LGFPGDFTALLAALPTKALQGIAQKWLDTDELKADNWQFQKTHDLLANLCTLAQKARARNSDIVVWISL
jgi:hypothetical protein